MSFAREWMELGTIVLRKIKTYFFLICIISDTYNIKTKGEPCGELETSGKGWDMGGKLQATMSKI